MKDNIRILLVDDETLLLESLEIILSMESDMTVVGKANDGKEALKILKGIDIDLALVDLNMIGMGGIQLIKELKQIYPFIKILVLTTFYDKNNIVLAIKNGADGYLLKDSGKSTIINAIHNVMDGQSILDKKVMMILSEIMNDNDDGLKNENQITKANNKNNFFKDFTKREIEICNMIAEGYNNSQIANFLCISMGTVKNYISSIYDKTDIHDRAALVVKLSKIL